MNVAIKNKQINKECTHKFVGYVQDRKSKPTLRTNNIHAEKKKKKNQLFFSMYNLDLNITKRVRKFLFGISC